MQSSRRPDFNFGPPDRRGGAEVVFFALKPPRPETLALTRLGSDIARDEGLTAHFHPPHRLHLSLLGWRLDDRTREQSIALGRELGRRIVWPTFQVILSAAMSFGRSGSRPLVLCSSPGTAWALTGLHDRLLETAAALGLGLRGRTAFEPHVTLAYSRAAIAERFLHTPIGWTAKDLVLILSQQGRGRHIELGRWPFLPPA